MPKSIDIVVQGNGAAFQPDRAGVEVGDRIHWNNETNEAHWLETTTGGFMTDNIPAGQVSNPGFIAAQDTSYRCRLHPQEQGTIVIVPAVVMAQAMELATAAPAAAPPSASDISAARKLKPAQGKKAAKKKAGGKKKNR
jgi:hypothetical protein